MTQVPVVASYRVSVVQLVPSALELEAQRDAVRAYLRGARGRLAAEFQETESKKPAYTLDHARSFVQRSSSATAKMRP